jgi:putative transposase
MHYSEALPDGVLDSRLLLDNGRWFIVVPTKATTYQAENQGRVVALDPGVRTFMTCYSPVEVLKFGDGDFARIVKLCRCLDDLKSRMTKVGARKRYRMRKAAKRLQWRIKDLVTELHWKVGTYLIQNYDVILLPTFKTQQMSSRAQRKRRSKTVRSMLTFGHFQFKLRIKHLAAKYGKTVIDVNEAYTRKTASWTGEIKATLGGAKTITFEGLTLDRDVNGARGILRRALVDKPSLAESVSVQSLA